jgi:hypothetical protein
MSNTQYTFVVHNDQNEVVTLKAKPSIKVGELRQSLAKTMKWNPETMFNLKLKSSQGSYQKIINNWNSYPLSRSPFSQFSSKPIDISVVKSKSNGGTRKTKQAKKKTKKTRNTRKQ